MKRFTMVHNLSSGGGCVAPPKDERTGRASSAWRTRERHAAFHGLPRVGIRGVARYAGVSIGTVANVLNGLDTVADGYAARVNAAVKALVFVPNDSPRQLKVGPSRSIALVVLSSFNAFFNSLAEHAEDA